MQHEIQQNLAIKVDLGTYVHKRSKTYLFKRALWVLFQPLFFPRTPRRLSFLRILALRAWGANIGNNCLICSGVRIWEPWNLEMGDNAAIGDDVKLYNLARIRIGAKSVVSQDSYLCTAGHDYLDSTFPLFSKPITIGQGAWLAARVFVSPGITVGDGAVVGACSVVTKDVASWTVCAGNPCRFIKNRVLGRL
jgi:putative colanic acid biosynthesis acetyltransferase WcaF